MPTQPDNRPDPVEVVREALRRWQAGEPMDELFAPDYEARGQPLPFALLPSRDPEARRRAVRDRNLRVHFGDELVRCPDDRVLVRAVWTHDGGVGAGSAGLVWTVLQVRDGRIAAADFLTDESEARRIAGLERD